MRFPFWWDRGAFIEKFSDRELDTGNPIDWNLAWLLSASEAAVWDDQCRAGYSMDPKDVDPQVLEEMGSSPRCCARGAGSSSNRTNGSRAWISRAARRTSPRPSFRTP
jgi:hypothetical protein